MSLPANSENILRFLTGISHGVSSGAWYVSTKLGETLLHEWDEVIAGIPQPTEQEIIDAGNDLTIVNGQVFSEWYAEHGGDATLTLRKKASDLLDKVNDSEALLRALVLVMVDEINILRAEHSLADRTAAQVRTAIKNKLNSGDADG